MQNRRLIERPRMYQLRHSKELKVIAMEYNSSNNISMIDGIMEQSITHLQWHSGFFAMVDYLSESIVYEDRLF